MKNHKSKVLNRFRQHAGALPYVILFALLGGMVLLISSHAANFALSAEAENGVLSGNAASHNDGNASGGHSVTFGASAIAGKTAWHYTANSTFDTNGNFSPGASGFNVADISSAGELTQVPSGDKALVYVGLCNGADSSFVSTLQPFKNQPKVYGFYLMDEPDPTGQYKPICTPSNLKSESDWIHANIPGTKAVIIMMNFGSESNPTYANEYTPSISDLDVIALDPYPCRTEINGCDYSMITKAVTAAEAAGVPLSVIAPVFQAFGGGNYADDGGGFYLLPSASQESQIFATWASAVPNPPMDYTYSWGSQNGDTALSQSPALQQIFAAHNNL